jgi:hypothetical protein
MDMEEKQVFKYFTLRYYNICRMEKVIRNRIAGKTTRYPNMVIQKQAGRLSFCQKTGMVLIMYWLSCLFEELIAF